MIHSLCISIYRASCWGRGKESPWGWGCGKRLRGQVWIWKLRLDSYYLGGLVWLLGGVVGMQFRGVVNMLFRSLVSGGFGGVIYWRFGGGVY